MTERKRLEGLIDDLPYSIRHEGSTETLIKYAKEQAERVQELDELVTAYQTELAIKNNALKRTKNKNKRYRETLETLYHKALYFSGYEDLDVHNPELFQFASAVSFSSQQALENEEVINAETRETTSE